MKLTSLLTKRQAEIFVLAAQGYTQREIAKTLKVSVSNVSNVLHKVYDKLEVRNVAEAIRESMLHGLLRVDDLERRPRHE